MINVSLWHLKRIKGGQRLMRRRRRRRRLTIKVRVIMAHNV